MPGHFGRKHQKLCLSVCCCCCWYGRFIYAFNYYVCEWVYGASICALQHTTWLKCTLIFPFSWYYFAEPLIPSGYVLGEETLEGETQYFLAGHEFHTQNSLLRHQIPLGFNVVFSERFFFPLPTEPTPACRDPNSNYGILLAQWFTLLRKIGKNIRRKLSVLKMKHNTNVFCVCRWSLAKWYFVVSVVWPTHGITQSCRI